MTTTTPTTPTTATAQLPTTAAAVEVAGKLYRSLGDPARLRIVLGLLDGERRVVDLVAELGLAQSTVSAHLACLRGCGLLTLRPVGRQSYYGLAHDVRDLLAATEQLLGRTGVKVALCPTNP